ncbi:lipopolysaccharide assembly protein LapA domain-containing protein [Actinomadura sp. DC4]|uniref:LapA family protein n=1 Tax=Actinomadura sp. DC4 TaxID=3055069 RepID=UPI0025AFC424|nr:lipopolysaccharide assembly protein LapA domain-containing protein [Actinomadura sp. DC4]MDN3351999.1 lipopolysaccharide assembly protein LapA domain-containing protein [Actinomadura sp. DC4]
MPLEHHPADHETRPATPAPAVDAPPSEPVAPARESRAVPATRTSVAWIGVWTATILLVAFIVFIMQNTRGVEVSFLWLHGTLPLAVGLLMATVAGVVVTLVLGTARITQLHRLARRRRP